MLTALLLASLALNGALLARAVIHRDGPAAKSVATAAAESRAHVTPAAVQQRLLSILVQRPNGRLPRSLIDPATGLARGNLEATCSGPGPAFDCVVRPASHASGEGLRVRYLPDGTFVWGSYAAKR